jgi:hypothetical protein
VRRMKILGQTYLKGRLDGRDDGQGRSADDDLLEAVPLVPGVDEAGLHAETICYDVCTSRAIMWRILLDSTRQGCADVRAAKHHTTSRVLAAQLASFPRLDLKSLILGFLIWGSHDMLCSSGLESSQQICGNFVSFLKLFLY